MTIVGWTAALLSVFLDGPLDALIACAPSNELWVQWDVANDWTESQSAMVPLSTNSD